MKPGRKHRSKYARRPRNRKYMKVVRTLPCVVGILRLAGHIQFDVGWFGASGLDPQRIVGKRITKCSGPIEADHQGTRPLGQKAADDTCAPMCQGHHGERTDYRGSFKGFTAEDMRTFCDWAIRYTRLMVEEEQRRERSQNTSIIIGRL